MALPKPAQLIRLISSAFCFSLCLTISWSYYHLWASSFLFISFWSLPCPTLLILFGASYHLWASSFPLEFLLCPTVLIGLGVLCYLLCRAVSLELIITFERQPFIFHFFRLLPIPLFWSVSMSSVTSCVLLSLAVSCELTITFEHHPFFWFLFDLFPVPRFWSVSVSSAISGSPLPSRDFVDG